MICIELLVESIVHEVVTTNWDVVRIGVSNNFTTDVGFLHVFFAVTSVGFARSKSSGRNSSKLGYGSSISSNGKRSLVLYAEVHRTCYREITGSEIDHGVNSDVNNSHVIRMQSIKTCGSNTSTVN